MVAFFNGVAIYRECSGVLKGPGVSASKQLVHAYANIDNRSFMHNMELNLQQWVDYEGENFTMFDPHVRQYFQDAYGVMCSKISYLKGGK